MKRHPFWRTLAIGIAAWIFVGALTAGFIWAVYAGLCAISKLFQ